jgi:hypothetical protein
MQDTIDRSRRKSVAEYRAEIAELLDGMRLMNEEIERDRAVSQQLKEDIRLLKESTRAKLREMGCAI